MHKKSFEKLLSNPLISTIIPAVSRSENIRLVILRAKTVVLFVISVT